MTKRELEHFFGTDDLTQGNNRVIKYNWNMEELTLKRNSRLLRTFGVSFRVLQEKGRMRVILKENTANYISLESLINVDFGKNMNCQFFKFRKRKLQKWPRKLPCVVKVDIWINRVPKFGRFLWNLAWTFLHNSLFVAIFNAMPIAYSLLLELDRLIKK